jgi:hypothetical protein
MQIHLHEVKILQIHGYQKKKYNISLKKSHVIQLDFIIVFMF